MDDRADIKGAVGLKLQRGAIAFPTTELPASALLHGLQGLVVATHRYGIRINMIQYFGGGSRKCRRFGSPEGTVAWK